MNSKPSPQLEKEIRSLILKALQDNNNLPMHHHELLNIVSEKLADMTDEIIEKMRNGFVLLEDASAKLYENTDK